MLWGCGSRTLNPKPVGLGSRSSVRLEQGCCQSGLCKQSPFIQRLQVCTLHVCNPRFGLPNTLIKDHIPWFRYPNRRCTNPKGTKENSLVYARSLLPLLLAKQMSRHAFGRGSRPCHFVRTQLQYAGSHLTYGQNSSRQALYIGESIGENDE